MREIPVSSLGTDKVRVEHDGQGSTFVGLPVPGIDRPHYVAMINDGCPTAALLDIAADRLSERDDQPGLEAHYAVKKALSFLNGDHARELADYATRLTEPAQPDADQIGEGR